MDIINVNPNATLAVALTTFAKLWRGSGLGALKSMADMP